MLLHRRFFKIFSERLDVSGDMQRFDFIQGAEPVMLAPGKEPAGRVKIRRPGVLVADGHGEEFQKPFRRGVAGVGDDRRHHCRGRQRRDQSRGLGGGNDGQFVVWILVCHFDH
jgi:hypothetical protein